MRVKTAIYISRNGKTLGRFSAEQIESLSLNGILREGDLGREDAQSEWQPLSAFVLAAAVARANRAGTAAAETGKNGSGAPKQAESNDENGGTLFDLQEESASAEQIMFIRTACGWVNPGLTKGAAAKLIQQLKIEALHEPLTDEQMRQLCFYGIEFPKGISCFEADRLIADFVRAHRGCEKSYRAWRRKCEAASKACS